MGVLLMYAGLVATFLGGLSLFRPLRLLGLGSRRRAAVAIGAGSALVTAAALFPAPLRRTASKASLLDEFLPLWQFAERHELRVHASVARTYAAIGQVTAGEIRLFQTLTWIRAPRLPGSRRPPSILNAASDRPILDVATSSGASGASGFFRLAEEPGREIVLGILVIAPPGSQSSQSSRVAMPEGFATLEKPGYARAAINFRVEDDGDGWCRLTTETRVHATDSACRRRFAAYWRLILPGSALIRRMWLAAIRERAESA
jgi:hypothetical protein